MRSEFSSVASRRPSIGSEVASHLTILRPRDTTPSDVLSTFGAFHNGIDEENWVHRAKLVFRILTFCLGPGNIWRFPEESFVYGNATYIYLYTFYIWVFGVSLLVFEITLSQYFVKGFAKIFTLCPMMEGITLAMVCYCVMANLVYSLVSVYSLQYFLSGANEVMPHSYCSELIRDFGCQQNYTNLSHSPEQTSKSNRFSSNHIERGMDLYGDKYNWKNAFVLVFIWSVLCVIMLFSILKYHWCPIVLSCVIFLGLLYVTMISLTSDGAYDGIIRMFIPRENDITRLRAWVYSIEQCVVTLGVGAGPLTTIWSTSKIKYWSHVDCLVINTIAFCCSILSGMIFFSAAGMLAEKHNRTIDELLSDGAAEFQIFVLVTQWFNMLNPVLNNITISIYYLILFSSCCYSLLEYTQVILLYIGSYVSVMQWMRKRLIIGVCAVLGFVIINIGVSKVGYPFIMAVNKNFIPTSILIILCFELFSVQYFYGLHKFCDDIDFMLGFAPNFYFQLTWVVLPGLLFIFSVASMYLKFQDIKNAYDWVALLLTIFFTIVPIFAFAIYRCVTGIRDVGVRRTLNPHLDDESDGELKAASHEDLTSQYPNTRSPNVPLPNQRYKSYNMINDTGQNDAATTQRRLSL